MSIYLWSDLHVGHKRALELMPERARVWSSIEQMSLDLIGNINEDLGPDDELWILGDAAMGVRTETLPYFEPVQAKITLFMGNHDKVHPSNPKSEEFYPLYLQYFDTIIRTRKIEIGGRQCILGHFPAQGDSHEGRSEDYSKWYPVDDGKTVMVHGHLHSTEIFTGPRQIHVGVDASEAWTRYGVKPWHPIPWSALESAIGDVHE